MKTDLRNESGYRWEVEKGQPKVLLIEDHELVAVSLASVLSTLGFEVRADFGFEKASVMALAAAFRPDVVLLDLILGDSGIDSIDLIGLLSAVGASVVVVSGVTDRLHLGRAARAGALAIVSKGAPLIELVEAIRGCLAGTPPGAVARMELLQELDEHEAKSRNKFQVFEPLTRREREVLVMLASGMSPKGIAQISHLKVGTIRSQIHSILAKLDVESQREAISLAFRSGWLDNVGIRDNNKIGLPARDASATLPSNATGGRPVVERHGEHSIQLGPTSRR